MHPVVLFFYFGLQQLNTISYSLSAFLSLLIAISIKNIKCFGIKTDMEGVGFGIFKRWTPCTRTHFLTSLFVAHKQNITCSPKSQYKIITKNTGETLSKMLGLNFVLTYDIMEKRKGMLNI